MSPLSVVVVNWKRYEVTRECLRALAEWKRLDPRILVADNESVAAEADRLGREFPRVEWLCSETNLGFGGGTNLALRRVRTEYALLLNNDAAIGEADVLAMIAALDRNERLFAVGPVIAERGGGNGTIAGGRDIARHVGTRWSLERLPTTARIEDGVFAVDYLPGAVVLLRVPVVRRLGYLVESYFFGGELADICRKARGEGLTVGVQVAARALHDAEVASTYREMLYPYYILRNRFLYLRRHERHSRLYLVPLWTAYGVAAALRAALRLRLRLARILGLALVDGLRGRFGDQNRRVLGASGGARP